jgi:hypothetical protein
VVVIDPAGSIPLLLVDPAHQRRGVGTRLLDGAMERLGELGAATVGLGSGGDDYLWPGVPDDLPAAAGVSFDVLGERDRAEAVAFEAATFPDWVVCSSGWTLGAGRPRRGRSRLRPRHGAGGRRPGRSCGRPGSPTSVPGLAAKAIIDILLVVPDPSDEPSYVPDLEAAGYVLVIREPDWYQHRCCKGPDTNVNLHVYPPGCPEIEAAP